MVACGCDLLGVVHVLGGDFLGDLGHSALGDLEALFNLLLDVLDRLLFLLDWGALGLGAGGEVARELLVGGEARAVLGDEVIEGDFKIALFEILVAADGKVSVISRASASVSASECCCCSCAGGLRQPSSQS